MRNTVSVKSNEWSRSTGKRNKAPGVLVEPIINKENNSEDYRLVQETLEGKKESFARLIDKYKNLVFSLALKMLGNHADSEDCAQEVFIQAFKHLPELKVNTKFYSWIYSITVNLCKNRIKRKGKLDIIELDEARETEMAPDKGKLEEDIFQKDEHAKRVAKILDILPEKYRMPFFLRYVEDRSYEEIAELTKLPLGTVKTYIHRAFDILIKKKNEIETF